MGQPFNVTQTELTEERVDDFPRGGNQRAIHIAGIQLNLEHFLVDVRDMTIARNEQGGTVYFPRKSSPILPSKAPHVLHERGRLTPLGAFQP
jgi:hypothetical protein